MREILLVAEAKGCVHVVEDSALKQSLTPPAPDAADAGPDNQLVSLAAFARGFAVGCSDGRVLLYHQLVPGAEYASPRTQSVFLHTAGLPCTPLPPRRPPPASPTTALMSQVLPSRHDPRACGRRRGPFHRCLAEGAHTAPLLR